MESSLRMAWTEIVTADDYDEHMATIGQAQAAADLTAEIIREAGLHAGSRLVVVGTGTGQMLDFMARRWVPKACGGSAAHAAPRAP